MSWLTDTPTSERFPLYTRANADEICPRPFTPLTWSLAWERGAVPGTVDGWTHLGAFRADEFRSPVAEVYGCWGGYLYNQVSVGRVFGIRAGSGPDDIDRTYFGSRSDVPPYVPHPGDADADLGAAAAARLGAAMAATELPVADELVGHVRSWVREAPDPATLDDAGLVVQARAAAEQLRRAWDVYIQVIICAGVAPSVVHALAGATGLPDDAVTALGAVGDVASAAANTDLWRLSRLAPGSAELATGLAAFLDVHGHRGPFEYELASPTWHSDPSIVHRLLERLRRQDDTQGPAARTRAAEAAREEATTRLAAAVAGDPTTAATLAAALDSARLHFRQREATKDALLRVNDAVRRPLRELAGRHAAALVAPDHLFCLLDDELDAFVAAPAAWRGTLEARAATLAELAQRQPPELMHHGDVPDPLTWPRRPEPGTPSGTAAAPEGPLQGIGVSPGTVTGPARVVDDLADVDELEPGDVLVCATTDPAWTPLLLTAAAVVCEVGAEGSHTAIVARELGIPAVMSVTGARSAVPDGALLTVDGAAGTVSVTAAEEVAS